MNPTDGTLHCEVHGLLDHDETVDVLKRAGMTADQVAENDARRASVLWRRSAAHVLDWWAHRSNARCVVIQ